MFPGPPLIPIILRNRDRGALCHVLDKPNPFKPGIPPRNAGSRTTATNYVQPSHPVPDAIRLGVGACLGQPSGEYSGGQGWVRPG